MDDKEIKTMMTSLKGLAYSRQSALQAILEVIEQSHLPAEEKLYNITMIVKSTGVTVWKDNNPTT